MKVKGLFIALVLVQLCVTSCGRDLWPSSKFAQANNYQYVNLNEVYKEELPYKIKTMPMYPNGIAGIMEDVRRNFKYPKSCKEQGIAGKVFVEFIVGENGYVKDVNSKNDIHPLLNAEAVRLVKSLQRWIPGRKMTNEFYESGFTVPINFQLL